MFSTVAGHHVHAPIKRIHSVEGRVRIPLRIQYLTGYTIATIGGALWPGILIGLLVDGPIGAVRFGLGLAPMFLPVTALVSLIWLMGALRTATAIERLRR